MWPADREGGSIDYCKHDQTVVGSDQCRIKGKVRYASCVKGKWQIKTTPEHRAGMTVSYDINGMPDVEWNAYGRREPVPDRRPW